jgi:hypothetical protein
MRDVRSVINDNEIKVILDSILTISQSTLIRMIPINKDHLTLVRSKVKGQEEQVTLLIVKCKTRIALLDKVCALRMSM